MAYHLFYQKNTGISHKNQEHDCIVSENFAHVYITYKKKWTLLSEKLKDIYFIIRPLLYIKTTSEQMIR